MLVVLRKNESDLINQLKIFFLAFSAMSILLFVISLMQISDHEHFKKTFVHC